MKRYIGLLGLVFFMSGPVLLRADTINSQAGLSGLCVYDATGATCAALASTTVAITPHLAWQPNFPDAVWISYKNTGITGPVPDFEPYNGTVPVFALTQTINASAGTLLSLRVWADDTAGVYLNNVQLKAPVFTQSTCADQPIGCETGEPGVFNVNLASGANILRFDVYQVDTGTNNASNPMGLLYKGTVPDGGVTLMLLGGALFGLETLRRKLRA